MSNEIYEVGKIEIEPQEWRWLYETYKRAAREYREALIKVRVHLSTASEHEDWQEKIEAIINKALEGGE